VRRTARQAILRRVAVIGARNHDQHFATAEVSHTGWIRFKARARVGRRRRQAGGFRSGAASLWSQWRRRRWWEAAAHIIELRVARVTAPDVDATGPVEVSAHRCLRCAEAPSR